MSALNLNPAFIALEDFTAAAGFQITGFDLLLCAWAVGALTWMGFISNSMRNSTQKVRIRAFLMCIIFGPFGASVFLGFVFFAAIKLFDDIYTDWTFPAGDRDVGRR